MKYVIFNKRIYGLDATTYQQLRVLEIHYRHAKKKAEEADKMMLAYDLLVRWLFVFKNFFYRTLLEAVTPIAHNGSGLYFSCTFKNKKYDNKRRI